MIPYYVIHLIYLSLYILRFAFLPASILYGGKYKSQLYNENIRTLELTPCLNHPASPTLFWAEVCRWSASLAGGSSCCGSNRWSHGARDEHHPLRHKRQRKWCATSVRFGIIHSCPSLPVGP